LTEDRLDEGIEAFADSTRFSDAEKAALHYVELVANDPDAIDQSTFDELRRYYTDADIVELTMFLFYNLGLHTFFGSLKFYPMFSPDGRLVSQEESARLYGASPSSLGASSGGTSAAGGE
jgi:hypothetical protein